METRAFFWNLANLRKDLIRSLRSLVPLLAALAGAFRTENRLHRASPGANTLAAAIRSRSLPARYARTSKAAPGITRHKHACGCYSQPLALCSLRSHLKGSTGHHQAQTRLRLLSAAARSLLATLAPQRRHRASPGANTLAAAIRSRSLPARFARTSKTASGRT